METENKWVKKKIRKLKDKEPKGKGYVMKH